MTLQVKSHLLRCIVHFFGIIGNQLVPPFPLNCLGTTHLLLNSFFILLTLYYMVVVDVLHFRLMVQTINISKPLFAVLVRFFMHYGMLSMIGTTQLYTLIFGPKIIEILNSPLFDSVTRFQSKVFTLKVVATFAIVNTLLVNCVFSFQFSIYWAWPPTLSSLTVTAVIYAIGTNTYFYLHLLLYAEYGTSSALRSLEVKLKSKVGNSCQTKLISDRLCQLALLHSRIVSLTSFPFTYYVFIFFIQFIVVWGCLSMFYKNCWDLIIVFYPGAPWVYITVFIIVNQNNLKTFDRIIKLINSQKQTKEDLQKRTKLLWKNIFENKFVIENDKQTFKKFSIRNMYLKAQYRRCFQLRLFNLVDVNLKFLFATLLLSFNFVVFLVQTK